MIAVKFVKRWDIYHTGLVAAFPEETSQRLVDQGFAMFYEHGNDLFENVDDKPIVETPKRRSYRDRIVKK